MSTILAITRLPTQDAATRHRVAQYSGVLSDKYGITVRLLSLYSPRVMKNRTDGRTSMRDRISIVAHLLYIVFRSIFAKHILILRDPVPFDLSILLRSLSAIGKKLFFDFDDAIHIGNPRIVQYLMIADFVTVGNQYLADFVRVFNINVSVIPTTVSVSQFQLRQDYESLGGEFRVGWIGSPSTVEYLSEIIPCLEEVGKDFSIVLVIVGATPPKVRNCRVEFHSWHMYIEHEITQTFDIGIAPLPNNEWTRGKCGFKIIEYMAAGIPVVASSVGVQGDIVVDGVTGYLVDSEQEWILKLVELLNDVDKRRQFGHQGRIRAKELYDITVGASLLAQTFNKVV